MIAYQRILAAITLVFAPSVLAAPFLPDNDGQVLERLPITAADNGGLRALRSALSANPKQLEPAIKLAKRYIALGKAEADPRYYGYAQGVLQPWWDSLDAPPEIALLKALILQNRHDFEGALQVLKALLLRQPDNAEAWLTQAIILQVRARYAEAQASCSALISLDAPIVASTCLASLGSLTGHAAQSYAFLQDALKQAPAVSPDQQLWSLTVLAEIAARMGEYQAAERHFKLALKVSGHDVYLLSAYADFLLDQQRPAEIITLLADKTRIDGLLLRVALAKQQLGADDLLALIAQLQARFAASRLRGENLHQGDEARFTLHILKQAQQAVPLALANWAAQKEPKDARIVMEAALAAADPAAATPVIELLQSTGMETVQLQKLASQLGGLKPLGQKALAQ
ncbi:MAG: hypothetical protein NTV43_00785 [Methylococcales bacterium]|nr:hypothetical protein [Methylococcales bacterium]